MTKLQKMPKINQLVKIEIPDNSGVYERYPSRVENINEKELVLVTPIKNRMPLFMCQNSSLSIWFWDNISVYNFHTYLIRNIIDTIYLSVVAVPDLVQRVEKREYVRADIVTKVLLSFTNNEGCNEKICCETRDISGGGFMFVSDKPTTLEQNTKVDLEFKLNDILLKAVGVIVWNDLIIDSDGHKRNYLGTEFSSISELNRKIIVKSVYQRQIELRRKGLL
ncbi:MAG: PilZ domain-containing protein [Clostridia bacterium]|nr:PilZ domain-containing protein [Clostridia bacterium]MDD4047607.1 PilZ domain-containing protein [Clostridia bacterium]